MATKKNSTKQSKQTNDITPFWTQMSLAPGGLIAVDWAKDGLDTERILSITSLWLVEASNRWDIPEFLTEQIDLDNPRTILILEQEQGNDILVHQKSAVYAIGQILMSLEHPKVFEIGNCQRSDGVNYLFTDMLDLYFSFALEGKGKKSRYKVEYFHKNELSMKNFGELMDTYKGPGVWPK